MRDPAIGAQRASLRDPNVPSATRSRSLVIAVLSAALLASLVAAPAAASVRTTVRIPSQQALQVTAAPRYWWPEEMFYLGLVNCTRTGGWVQSNGSCKGYGSGRYSTYVAPFRHSATMSDTVARPFASVMARKGVCDHYYGGSPVDRMKRAGYTSVRNWGENIGCRSGSYARTAVLASHLFFQSEKSSNGGHWRNIKNPAFHWIAIGVWKYGNRIRLVTDFVA